MKTQQFRTPFALSLGLAAIAACGVIAANVRAHEDGAPGCCPSPLAKAAGKSLAVERNRTMQNIAPDRMSFYSVPLVCPAAPEIGCGSRSKPVLLALERRPEVAQAWLNRPGTLIAVVWEKDSSQAARDEAIRSLAKQQNFDLKELKEASRNAALKEFSADAGWYRGAEVDRLSEEEAGIIAARIVRRMKAKTTLTDEQGRALEAAFANVFHRRFVSGSTKLAKTRQDGIESAILKAARVHLDEQGIVALQQALASGCCPLPNEK